MRKSNWTISPIYGVKRKNIRNHHLDDYSPRILHGMIFQVVLIFLFKKRLKPTRFALDSLKCYPFGPSPYRISRWWTSIQTKQPKTSQEPTELKNPQKPPKTTLPLRDLFFQEKYHHKSLPKNPPKTNRLGRERFSGVDYPGGFAASPVGAKVPNRTRMNRWRSTVRKCRTIPNQHLGDRRVTQEGIWSHGRSEDRGIGWFYLLTYLGDLPTNLLIWGGYKLYIIPF